MKKNVSRKQRYYLDEPSGQKFSDRLRAFSERFDDTTINLFGIILITFALMSFLAILGVTSGTVLTPWSNILRRWFGFGAFFLMSWILAIGLRMLRKPQPGTNITGWFYFRFEITLALFLMLMSQLGGISIERAEAGLDGGYLGWALAQSLNVILPISFLQIVLTLLLLVIFIIWSFDLFDRLENFLAIKAGFGPTSRPVAAPQPVEAPEQAEVPSEEAETPPTAAKKPRLAKEFQKKLSPTEIENEPASYERASGLPPLTILAPDNVNNVDERHINQTAGLIEQTLSDFGIPAKVIGYRSGPTVTQFAVKPGYIKKAGTNENDEQQMKVRVSKILGLQKDLALAISAQRLRIEAPVPGRSYVGIEVPNSRSSMVRLRSILDSQSFLKLNSPLAFILGKDVSGHPVVADLAKMPHLLVAGQTGSGKSVFIAALATTLAMNNHPQDLKLVMIDVKMVELIRFNGLNHMLGRVETNVERILGVLRWLVMEMEHRYKLLESARARDVISYNKKVKTKLSRIVVIIDELADLMMSSPDQVEHHLIRLAQKARATGIHLVVATQRPSTDVVTGLIKANFPARLAFSVASGVDSRVILDSSGAENLLGRGDLLFLNPEIGNLIRAQGVLVTDEEVEKLISYWQKNSQREQGLAPWEMIISEPAEDSDDALIDQAIEIVRSTQKASASLIQRKLKIGYPRAARLIDQMEEMGIIGPSAGGGREREVLVEPNINDEE